MAFSFPSSLSVESSLDMHAQIVNPLRGRMDARLALLSDDQRQEAGLGELSLSVKEGVVMDRFAL